MLELLGEGGCGKVFKAYSKQKSVFMALKFYKDPTNDTVSEMLREDFIMRQIENMKDERFLKYYGVFSDPKMENGYILAMESGERNLDEILKMRKTDNKNYQISEIIYIFHSLTMDYLKLQQNRIANRDVKPANIVLVSKNLDKNEFFYKISDFGISAVVEANKNEINFSEEFRGSTPNYAAPEIRQMNESESFKGNYDPFKADIYSLGLLILRLLGYEKKSSFKRQISGINKEFENILIKEY